MKYNKSLNDNTSGTVEDVWVNLKKKHNVYTTSAVPLKYIPLWLWFDRLNVFDILVYIFIQIGTVPYGVEGKWRMVHFGNNQ